jgi:predicted DCC family thiol-disulfide oxidoreductase YuxK
MENTLFYDGNCPLCAKEITLLKRFKDSSLHLVDIHSIGHTTIALTKTKVELLSVLHLKSSDNSWQSGVDASVTAWGHTPFGWILRPLRWPVIKTVVDWLYYKWADNRVCRLGYKDDTQVAESK